MFPPLRQRSDARMNGTHPGGQARIARERVSLATNCEQATRLLVDTSNRVGSRRSHKNRFSTKTTSQIRQILLIYCSNEDKMERIKMLNLDIVMERRI